MRNRRRATARLPIIGGPFDGGEIEVPRKTAPGLEIDFASTHVDGRYILVTETASPSATAAVFLPLWEQSRSLRAGAVLMVAATRRA